VAGRSVGAVTQPGAKRDQTTYCPVSGAVFRVGDRPGRGRREVAGQALHFCCEACAEFFSKNQDRVIALRKYPLQR
jgi:hypothetical protein